MLLEGVEVLRFRGRLHAGRGGSERGLQGDRVGRRAALGPLLPGEVAGQVEG